jgi:hypothetical protein
VFVRRESSELNEAAGRFDDTVSRRIGDFFFLFLFASFFALRMKPFSFIVPENLLLSDLDLWSKVIKRRCDEKRTKSLSVSERTLDSIEKSGLQHHLRRRCRM